MSADELAESLEQMRRGEGAVIACPDCDATFDNPGHRPECPRCPAEDRMTEDRDKGCAECTPDGNGRCLEGCRAKPRHVHDEWCEIDWDEVFGR